MSIHRYILAALLGLFLATSIGATPALADGGDVRNKLIKLEEKEIDVEDNIHRIDTYFMENEFDLSLTSITLLNINVLNQLFLREIRIRKAILSRELLMIRMRQAFLHTPLGVAYALQSIAIFTMLGTPPYTNLAFEFNPVLWQASVALMTYYFIVYLGTPEGQFLVANLTEAMSYGQYGYDAVFNTQYAE